MPIKTDSEWETRVRSEPMRLYNTVVHNCECHTFDDVTFGLMRIVGMGLRDAERKSREIDFFGSGVVATSPLEVAELYAERLQNEVLSRWGTRLKTSISPA
jgi:ATP-dependent Clp protease adapter protein ClpS